MNNTSNALVLGATGGVGGAIGRALIAHGWHVRAMVRNPKAASAQRLAKDGFECVAGDALDSSNVVRAASGVRVIVHAVNPPGYRNWDTQALPMLENTIEAARTHGARILFPGTVYNYGPDAFPVLCETSPQNPHTRKGAIRVQMEQKLADAAKNGVRSLIVRAGDFYGPRVGNSWFSQALVKPARPLKKIVYPGKRGIGHTWAYLPDLGETFAQLADREQDLAPMARFHFAGYYDADGTGMVSAIKQSAAKPNLPIRHLPWRLLALMSPFNETLEEMREIKTYWRNSARLDNTALTAFLGTEPHTPLNESVRTTLSGLSVI